MISRGTHLVWCTGWLVVGLLLAGGAAVYHGYHQRAVILAHFRVDNVRFGDYTDYLERYGNGKPIMISRASCPSCQRARAWLRAHRLQVVLVLPGKVGALDHLTAQLPTQGTPTLILADRVIVGFQPGYWQVAFQGD